MRFRFTTRSGRTPPTPGTTGDPAGLPPAGAAGGAGAAGTADKLLPLVYGELRALAAQRLRAERRNHTLQATALVHEAYLRLAEQTRAAWQDKTHFLAVGAQVIRRILVDHARSRAALKRGGGARLTLHDTDVAVGGVDVDVLALHEALEELARLDPRQAQVVELRFFGGLSVAESAGLLGVSERTVEGDWQMAKAWLRRKLSA